MASGFLEVQGFSAALYAMDAMCKAGDIRIEAVDANNTPDEREAVVPVVIQIKCSGGIGDVRSALEAGRYAAEKLLPAHLVLSHCIASESPALRGLLREGKLPRRRAKPHAYAALAALDIRCFAHAIHALDDLCKGSGAEIVGMKKYLGGQMVTLLLGGTVSEVQAVMELAGRLYADCGAFKNAAVILKPHEELYHFIG